MHTNIKNMTVLTTFITTFLCSSLTWASVFLQEEGCSKSIREVAAHPYAEAVGTFQHLVTEDKGEDNYKLILGVAVRIHPGVYMAPKHHLEMLGMETYTCVNLDSVFDGTEVLVDETIPKDSIIGHPTVDIALLFTDRYPGICAPIQADYVPSRSSVLTGISTVSPRFISETDSEKFSNIIRRRHLFEHVISDGRSLDNGFALPILEFPQDEPTSGRLKETIEKFGEAPLDSHFSIYDTTNISTLSSLATVGDSGAPLFDKGNHSIVAIVKGYSYCIAKFPDGGDKGIVENTYITFNKALIEWIDTTIRSRYPAHTTVAYTAAGDAATAAGDAGTAAADGAGASAAGGAGASALGGTGTAAAGGAGASAGASAGTY